MAANESSKSILYPWISSVISRIASWKESNSGGRPSRSAISVLLRRAAAEAAVISSIIRSIRSPDVNTIRKTKKTAIPDNVPTAMLMFRLCR